MFVVAPFDRLIVIAAAEQQYLHGKVDLRKARQPNALGHTRLVDHQRRAGFERRDETAGYLEAFRQTRFQTNYLLVNRVYPNDPDQFCDQALFTVLRSKTGFGSEVEDDRFAAFPLLAAR